MQQNLFPNQRSRYGSSTATREVESTDRNLLYYGLLRSSREESEEAGSKRPRNGFVMPKFLKTLLARYGMAVAAVAIAAVSRQAMAPALGKTHRLSTFYVAVIFTSWGCGLGPSVLAMTLGAVASFALFMDPFGSDGSIGLGESVGVVLYFGVSAAIIAFGESGRSARRSLEADVARRQETEDRLHQQREWLRVTLASIGDAVIATNVSGRVSFLNSIAEELTGWSQAEAVGLPLGKVFSTVDESTGDPLENLGSKALNAGHSLDGSSRSLLVTRDGAKRAIDGRAAPIRDGSDRVIGAVVIFRDVNEKRRAERALEMNEARKAAILETALDAIITIDHRGRVIEWNPAAERIFGFDRGIVMDRPLADLIIPAELREAHRRGLARYLETGDGPILGRRFEIQAIRADGSELPVELAITRIPIEGPPVFTAHARDISERKLAEAALRESEWRFRELAEAMPQIVWTARPDGHIDYYNERWSEFAGLPDGTIGDDSWKPVLHPDDLERTQARWSESVRSGAPFDIEYRFWDRRRGEYRWFLARALAARDASGRVVRWHGTCTDISDQKRAEEVLLEVDRRKNDFLAMLAHELRNPLAPVRNALELLKLAGENSVEAASLRAMMERQVNNMARLVEDLLDVSRIDRGKIELRRQIVDLVVSTRHALDAGRAFAEGRGHILSVTLSDEPILVDADPTRLEQILDNLITNASKYTDPGGRIDVSVAREGDAAVIRIRDNGVGIEPAMLSKVFDLFVQAERRVDRAQGGLGIGLSLVQTLVTMHGGTVHVHSEGLGQGSEFTVRLPIATGVVATNGSPTAVPDPAPPRRRIMIVDDNQDAAETLARLLTRLYQQDVRVAYDGASALDLAASFRPEVVLLDIGLPGMDGYEVARRLRSSPDLGPLTLAALTGWGQDHDRARSRAAGFDHHLVKPVEIDSVRQLLD